MSSTEMAPNSDAGSRPIPATLAYCAEPGPYLTEHAADVAALYDGLFFLAGNWDAIAASGIAVPGEDAPSDTAWLETVRANVAALRAAGACENLLGVHFDENGSWPTPEALTTPEFTARMARHFAALGRTAGDLGFRGVCIDIEYPYKRCELDHRMYGYQGYTVDDLLSGAREQGAASVGAILDAFPDAVILVLPGDPAIARPVGRAFLTGMLGEMARRDAPGGLHLGAERSYGLYDPTSQVAIPLYGRCRSDVRLRDPERAYFRARCTVAPGVWPLHMVETEPRTYPVRSWREELAELRQQMRILRQVAQRYVWSYSSCPLWGPPTSVGMERAGPGGPAGADIEPAIAGWRAILEDRAASDDPRIASLVRAVREYEAGSIDGKALCDRFGTPAEWLVLGMLGNPHGRPQFLPAAAVDGPGVPEEPLHGRDGVVRWFRYRNMDPVGCVNLADVFDHRNTDQASAVLVCDVVADYEATGRLWLNWDDGVVVRIDGEVVFDRATYPPRGHGLLYRDRYLFETSVPVALRAGRHRISILSINAHGLWGVAVRFADAALFPLEGLRFELPEGW